jgi:GR25 family glycosyltransferase involved in LPS biosynthesis
MKMPTYIVTLPDNPARIEEIKVELLAYSFIETIVIEGLRGGLLADAACRTLTRNAWSVNFKGALGCFLAHARIWQLVTQRSERVSLVLEDDSILENLDVMNGMDLPEDCDVAFCNARTCYHVEGQVGPIFRSLAPVPQFVITHGQAIGTDGYLITPKGAEKLLSFIEKDSFFSHVDLRMMAYSLERGWDTEFPAEGQIIDNLKVLQNTYSENHKIKGYSFYPPISQHAGGLSRRHIEDIQNATLDTTA